MSLLHFRASADPTKTFASPEKAIEKHIIDYFCFFPLNSQILHNHVELLGSSVRVSGLVRGANSNPHYRLGLRPPRIILHIHQKKEKPLLYYLETEATLFINCKLCHKTVFMVTGQEAEYAATRENTLFEFFKDYFALQIIIALPCMSLNCTLQTDHGFCM